MPLSARKEVTTGKDISVGAKAKEAIQKVGKKIITREWVDSNDTLLDKAADSPITLDVLLADKLLNKSFSHKEKGEIPFDWSEFRQALEARSPDSPRWFIQLRQEDLLLGPHGLDGVTVDCFVVVEAKEPTFSPAEYVVKAHWPYSDAEDNAPERILPISGQQMCWRRVVKNGGEDINVFFLQRRSDPSGSSILSNSSMFGFGVSSSTSNAASAPSTAPAGFGFGASAPAAPNSFSFNALSAPASAPSTAPAGFGFGASAPAAPNSFSFNAVSAPASAPSTAPAGFGFGASAPAAPNSFSFNAVSAPASAPSTAPAGFGFGVNSSVSSSAGFSFEFDAGTEEKTADTNVLAKDRPEVQTQQLKPSDLLFALWSLSRLDEMEADIRSGSRIVREGFQLNANTKIKVVMQNDVEDNVPSTAYRLLLTKLFAKTDDAVQQMDKWIDDCPVYDEEIATAMQDFRERRLQELAEESDSFKQMVQQYQPLIESELHRIIEIRRQASKIELERIEKIRGRIHNGTLLEKKHFRLLKYYAKNDLLPFRPFGKISGISEMGECVDVCFPPAHVHINPFTNKPM